MRAGLVSVTSVLLVLSGCNRMGSEPQNQTAAVTNADPASGNLAPEDQSAPQQYQAVPPAPQRVGNTAMPQSAPAESGSYYNQPQYEQAYGSGSDQGYYSDTAD